LIRDVALIRKARRYTRSWCKNLLWSGNKEQRGNG